MPVDGSAATVYTFGRKQAPVAHGIDFEDAIAIWEEPVLEVPSPQGRHGEDRVLTIGTCEGRVITVVFTRAARKNERENYQKAIERAAER